MKRWRKKLWKERTEQDNKTNLINVINGGDAVIKVSVLLRLLSCFATCPYSSRIPPSSGVKVPGPIDRLRSKLITFAMMGYLILRSWEQLKVLTLSTSSSSLILMTHRRGRWKPTIK